MLPMRANSTRLRVAVSIGDTRWMARVNAATRAVCRVANFGAIATLCSLCVATAALAQAGPAASDRLVVSGNVEKNLTLTVADLQRLPVKHIDDVRQLREQGASTKDAEQTRRYAGVLLRDVVSAAKPVEKTRNELRRSVVVVTAADGYQVVFSWAELFLSANGDGALVVFERDGAPLPADEGPLAVVSLRDSRLGPRHVKWLTKVDVRRIGE